MSVLEINKNDEDIKNIELLIIEIQKRFRGNDVVIELEMIKGQLKNVLFKLNKMECE
jgi:hypothetical protein